MILTPTETDIIKGIPIPLLPKKGSVCSLSDVGCHDKWLPEDVELWNSSSIYPVESFVHYISGGKLPGSYHSCLYWEVKFKLTVNKPLNN